MQKRKPALPEYQPEEIARHNRKESVWVTYKDGVYDVTEVRLCYLL